MRFTSESRTSEGLDLPPLLAAEFTSASRYNRSESGPSRGPSTLTPIIFCTLLSIYKLVHPIRVHPLTMAKVSVSRLLRVLRDVYAIWRRIFRRLFKRGVTFGQYFMTKIPRHFDVARVRHSTPSIENFPQQGSLRS